jgi:hypothetical protein
MLYSYLHYYSTVRASDTCTVEDGLLLYDCAMLFKISNKLKLKAALISRRVVAGLCNCNCLCFCRLLFLNYFGRGRRQGEQDFGKNRSLDS